MGSNPIRSTSRKEMVEVITAINWRKSSFSGDKGGGQDSGGNCVELEPSFSMIRDSKNASILNLNKSGILSFVKTMKK
jgi:hypothetical protein